MQQEGGCLCGNIKCVAKAVPIRVTTCYCTFCQRATGSTHMVEPIFNKSDFSVVAGKPTTFQFPSTGSGKLVTVHFCRVCGTKLFLSFERFPDIFGVYIGIFDEPNWISIGPDNGRWIYLDSASKGVMIPAGVEVFSQHALAIDGSPNEPIVFDEPYLVT